MLRRVRTGAPRVCMNALSSASYSCEDSLLFASLSSCEGLRERSSTSMPTGHVALTAQPVGCGSQARESTTGRRTRGTYCRGNHLRA